MNVSRYAFIHAKMHGLMAKAFFDERLKFLTKIANLLDLSQALFPGSPPPAGEAELVSAMQRKFEASVIAALLRLLDLFPEPPPLLVHLVREYDYRNLLTLLREKFSGLTNIRLWDTGKYSLLTASGPEDFPRMLANTRFEKYIALMESLPLAELEFEAGKQYYEELTACARALPSAEKRLILPLLKTELLLENLVWALRLRFCFRMGFEEAKEKLFPLDFFTAESVRPVFELSPESPQDWESLGFRGIFSAERGGVIDLPAIETRVGRYLYKKFRRVFYSRPFTLASVYAFFRVKKHEARLVTSVSEGISMSISAQEMEEAIGV
ncbi:MAG: V-type ATPase subunit [Spirochaetaceae bacterium]|nr:V-type ATPase subunit [Spirochaetaceae bacterium]